VAAEAWATLLLRDSFSSVMQDLADGGQLQQLFNSIEVPVQRVLSAMEVTGVRCDKQRLMQQRDQLQVRQAGTGRRGGL
jgi:DNA polymerase I-like protein with 3'-5' exonuclease and polymerase domains